MKKVLSILLIALVATAAVFAVEETTALEVKTVVGLKNVISFKYADNGAISNGEHVFSATENSKDFKVNLWTNKATGAVPSVKLTATALRHTKNPDAYIKYVVNGTNIANPEEAVVVAENIFAQTDIEGNEANDYGKNFTVALDTISRAAALVGNYKATLTVTVTQD